MLGRRPRSRMLPWLLAAAVAVPSCAVQDSTPTEVGCLQIDGAYAYEYQEAGCSRSGSSETPAAVVNQSGCRFNVVLPGYALVDGTIDGNSIFFSVTYLVSGSTGCGNVSLSGTGSAGFAGGRMTLQGTYGTASAPAGSCTCLPGPGEARFALK